MGKLIVLLALAAVLCRVLSSQWPWQLWQKSEQSQKEAVARSLLGVNRNATRAEIVEAHRRRLAQVHPDRGGTNEAVHAATAARELLLARLDRIEAGK